MLIDGDTITGDYPVLFKLPNGDQKTVRLKTGSRMIPDVRLGKVRLPSMSTYYYIVHHSSVKSIVGSKYGSTICKFDGRSDWTRIQRSQVTGSLDENPGDDCMECSGSDEDVDTKDPEKSEPENGQHAGHSRAIDSALNNPAFSTKTKFSQEKYLRKKHQKYSKEITMLKPSLKDFCDGGMVPVRADMLGSIIRFAGVRAGSVVGIVDDGVGIVTTALLQRECLVDRYVLGKATGTERAQCIFNLDKSPLFQNLTRLDDPAARYYDSLVIINSGQAEASIRDTFDALQPRLKLAGTLVIYSAYIEPLLNLVYELREEPKENQEFRYLNVQLTEQMLREHEIVKERTHPIMKQSVGLFKGFILSAIKVCT